MMMRSITALLVCAASLVWLAARPAVLRAQAGREVLAVLDLEVVGGSEAQATALSNQLRSEILATGRVTLVDRSDIDSILDEQAFQQTGCTSQECAVRVGRILGIRKIVAGTITRLGDTQWQIAVRLIDVETSETLRAHTYNHEQDFRALLGAGMAEAAANLTQYIGLTGATLAEAERQDAERGAWKDRLRWLAGLGIASAALSFYEAERLRVSNDEQKKILSKMETATSWERYRTLRKNLSSEKEQAQRHKDYSDASFLVSAALLGAAAWVYFDPPAASDSVTILPIPLGPDAAGIVLAARW